MASTQRVLAVALFGFPVFAQPLRLSTTELQFSGYTGGEPPPPAAIVVTSSNQTPIRFTIRTDAPKVISFTPGAADTPARVLVSVDPANLAAGVYQARILITDPVNGPLYPTAIPVTFTVESRPPALDVSPAVLRLAARDDGPDDDATLFVRNSGGAGQFPFTVSAPNPVPWILGISPSEGVVGPGQTVPVTIRIAPQAVTAGVYRAVLRFTSPAGSADVPVAFYVARHGPALQLNPSGFQFEVRQGAGTALTRRIAVINRGSDSLDWSADVLQGSDWLKISDTAGTASTDNPGAITVLTDDTKLRTGVYYGLLRISSPTALNSPQLFPIALNVLDPATAPRVGLSPGGLFFVAVTGQPPPPAQAVQIYASSLEPVPYQNSGYTTDGQGWLLVSSNAGSTYTARTGQTMVSVNHANLQPGIFTGEVAYSFSNSDVRAASVTLVVLPRGATPYGAQRAAVPGCNPSRLALTQSALTAGFNAAVGWPTPLTVRLSDDCGSAVPNGQVVLTFSNGDPPQTMSLAGPDDGSYSATWTPAAVLGNVSVVARALAPGFPALSAQITGAVAANKVPVLRQDSTVDSFSLTVSAPLGPGTMALVSGTDLAVGQKAAGVNPLPFNIDGTRVLIGGIEAPVASISPGQIRTQIPLELDPNRVYQVLVTVNGAITAPDLIAIAPAQPALQAPLPERIVTAQHKDTSAVTAASPAHPGEEIVVFAQGLGLTDPRLPSGAAPPADLQAKALIQPAVTLGGDPAEILFAGLSPGIVGLNQINLRIPSSARTGNLELTVKQGAVSSNSGFLPVSE